MQDQGSLTPRVTLDCLKINTLFKSTPRAICKKSLNLTKNTSLLPEIPEINSVTFPLMIETRDTPTDETLKLMMSNLRHVIESKIKMTTPPTFLTRRSFPLFGEESGN